jgi:radical SAM protein with 4Fe4S-binding SPASM domain
MIPYFETITFQGRAAQHLELGVTPGQLYTLFHELSEIDRERFGFDWDPHPPVVGLTCNRHAYTCTVTVKGDIIPCPGVDITVGNIRQEKLADILRTSEVIHNLRNIRENIKGPCGTCENNLSCYGCRGMAYQVTGDYLASDPLCWKNPENQANAMNVRSFVLEEIIPHKPPFVMVSRLEEAGEGDRGDHRPH